MTLYSGRATTGREATYAEKEASLLEALELEFLDECHPNTADILKRRLLPLESDHLLMVLELIVVAKENYASRMASAS
ncbi:MAG TPA: hypothetical protein VGC82_11840 [Rhodopila sp.]